MLVRLFWGLTALALLGVGCATGLGSGVIGSGGGGTGGIAGDAGEDGAGGAPMDAPGDGPIACLHASDCTSLTDSCSVGSCVNNVCARAPTNEGAPCDDGDYCTDGDTCHKGTCVGGSMKTCPQPDDCHVGVCDPASKSCLPQPGNDGAPCNANDVCKGPGACFSGVCSAPALDCSFLGTTCSMGVCDPMLGCTSKPFPDGTTCANPFPSLCTSGACKQGVCGSVPANEGGTCDDGLFCTINDKCHAGVCTGGGPNLCSGPTGCFVGSCNEATKTCTSMPGNDGAPCTDSDVCNAGKHCLAGACSGGTPANDGLACASSASCVVGTTCAMGVCGGGTGPVIYFSDDFHDNSRGWMLDPEWQIGPAMVSSGQNIGNPDPAMDHSPTSDNGVAGVVIGGNESPVVHPYRYLTSPPFDTSGATGSVILGYYRWLNSDYDPFMHNSVDVFDGASWVNLWTSGAPPGIADASWTYVSFDLTAHKSAAMRVRFGFDIATAGVFTVSQWNLDDVLVASAACP